MRIGILLSLLSAGVAFCTEPAVDADSSRQSMPRQAVSSGLPLPPRPTPDTSFGRDTSCLVIPCALALGAWDAIGRGRACEEPGPCLALGFVLVICALLVLNGITHP
jgi:hypothetical protein